MAYVLPARVALPRRYCLRYLGLEVKRCRASFYICSSMRSLWKPSPLPAKSPHPAVIADPQLKAGH